MQLCPSICPSICLSHFCQEHISKSIEDFLRKYDALIEGMRRIAQCKNRTLTLSTVWQSSQSLLEFTGPTCKMIKMYLKIQDIFTRPNEFLPDMSVGQTEFCEDWYGITSLCHFCNKKFVRSISLKVYKGI